MFGKKTRICRFWRDKIKKKGEKMDRKIGVLTFHRTSNFGSSLQAYGLYEKIRDLGYSCEIIDYRCPAIEKRENLKPELRLSDPKGIVRQCLYGPAIKRKAQKLEQFGKEKMMLSKPYEPDNIGEAEPDYSKIIVGSDIVWGRDITEDDYTYFLDFVRDDFKKYAFSSSVGNCDIRENEEKLSGLLKSFQRIAVREDEAVSWVRKISGREAEQVCDPTLLLTTEEWERAIPPSSYPEDDYVLVYFDSDDHKCLHDAISYAKANNKKVYYINYYRPAKNAKNVKPTSLEQFLGLIKHASMVFTASYHGMLFSIYFHRQFFFYTRAHKSRVISLAKRLGVLDRCGDELDVRACEKIDYASVDRKLQDFRHESVMVLKEMLNA